MVRKRDFMPSPLNPEQDSKQDEWETPNAFGHIPEENATIHSGKLPGELREDHPTKEFTSQKPGDQLESVAEEGILYTPEDPGSLPEQISSDFNQPTAVLSRSHPENITPWYKKPIVWVGAGVGALAFTAFGLSLNADNDEPKITNPSEQPENTPIRSSPTTSIIATPTTEFINEVLIEPVVMDSTDPQELFDQYSQNVNCMFSRNSHQAKLDCLALIFEDNSVGPLSRGALETIDKANFLRANNPEFEYSYFGTVDGSDSEIKYRPNSPEISYAKIVAIVTDGGITTNEFEMFVFKGSTIDNGVNKGKFAWRLIEKGPFVSD